mmetsp:Transcript_5841/g.16492  ORF Transcript_5841/g.16492 Transcript_5841/m.16492 type:complete len:250 (-) Transcript_5841:165-914(-)
MCSISRRNCCTAAAFASSPSRRTLANASACSSFLRSNSRSICVLLSANSSRNLSASASFSLASMRARCVCWWASCNSLAACSIAFACLSLNSASCCCSRTALSSCLCSRTALSSQYLLSWSCCRAESAANARNWSTRVAFVDFASSISRSCSARRPKRSSGRTVKNSSPGRRPSAAHQRGQPASPAAPLASLHKVFPWTTSGGKCSGGLDKCLSWPHLCWTAPCPPQSTMSPWAPTILEERPSHVSPLL